MKNKHNFGVNFILRSRKDAQGKFPVYVRIIINANRVELSMNTSLYADQWNHGNGEALPLNDELIQLNQHLLETKTKLRDHFLCHEVLLTMEKRE